MSGVSNTLGPEDPVEEKVVHPMEAMVMPDLYAFQRTMAPPIDEAHMVVVQITGFKNRKEALEYLEVNFPIRKK